MIIKKIGIFLILIISSLSIYAQTVVKGKIIDAQTGETIPFATVYFLENKKIIQTADLNGKFVLSTNTEVNNIVISYIGYSSQTIKIKKGEQTLNIRLEVDPEMLDEVVVKGKATKYSSKNNPAVDLLREIVKHKNNNRIQSQEYYQYNKYEKLELAFNNIGINDSANLKGIFKKADFLLDFVDTSELTGERILPFFFREVASDVYFRQSPKTQKEIVRGERNVEFHHFIDPNSLNTFINSIFSSIDLYDNQVNILQVGFMSPLSSMAPGFFQYHILDTLKVEGYECIKLEFYPRNTGDLAFSGDIYVLNDSSYAVKKINMRTPRNTGINFVRNFSLTHSFNLVNGVWCLTDDHMSVEFVLAEGNKRSILGTRTATHKDYVINKPVSESIYAGLASTIKVRNSDKLSELEWTDLRHEQLSRREEGVFDMVDSLKRVPAFRLALNAVTLIFSGYSKIGKIDIGPVASFASWNDLEGFRLRLGGKTNADLHPNWFLSGYGAYGFKDKRFKYNGMLMYSFNKKREHPWEFPMNLLSVKYEYDMRIPSQSFMFGEGDKIFLSVQRGKSHKMNYERKFEIDWNKEFLSGFSIQPNIKWLEQDPQMELKYIKPDGTKKNRITTSRASLGLRYAPKESYYQDQANRYPVDPSNPIFTFTQTIAFKNVFNGEHFLNRTDIGFEKRFWVPGMGFLDAWVKAGKIWNKGVPYPLLAIPHANQNYAYQDEAFNLMRFMEFVNDQYVTATLAYCFNGVLLNRVPLIKKLKLREIISFKMVWGSLDSKNNPINNPNLFVFPEGTYPLSKNKPYMEVNVAVDNLFKILRIDLIRRLNYLDHPGSIKWGLGFRIRPGF